ncbi:hypothetical protein DSO57_1037741 [Entomophthora muscae]|uniref:Uncharacterized protein n=1 Tax=Entomophthora muscae TaxID=34485 RepID=A0ACC2RPV5_9FUNG|nr:hypothetical protein DSO57_1037741 [Entomophthora muscae]
MRSIKKISSRKSIYTQFLELGIIKEFEDNRRYINEPEVTGYKKFPVYHSSKVEKEMPKRGSLIRSTLSEANKIPFPPHAYYHSELNQIVEIGYAGNQLSDDKGNVHEGLLSALLDEALGRTAFLRFLTPYMFTANLTVVFKDKLPENSFFKIVTKLNPTTDQKPYKAILESQLLDLSGKEIAAASSVFIVPKNHLATIGSFKSYLDFE